MGFSTQIIDAVWQKANPVAGETNVFRKDVCGAWIHRPDYGNRNASYGWEIDHINPNGGDDLANLQPLHWQNNAAKGDGALRCVVVSAGNRNIGR